MGIEPTTDWSQVQRHTIHCFHITFTVCWSDTLFPLLDVFCSSLVLVFLCVILLLIAMSCHCPFCVRLSHSIKGLLTYLLIYFLTYLTTCYRHVVVCLYSVVAHTEYYARQQTSAERSHLKAAVSLFIPQVCNQCLLSQQCIITINQ